MTEHVRIGERTFSYLPHADRRNFSSFNIGCERKSEKCILSYGHVLSIGTSQTNPEIVFGGVPGSSD